MSFCKPTRPGRHALALCWAAGLTLPLPAAGQTADPWRPRTAPLYGVSYAPDVGLLIGAGLVHTRYAFRALPPSTRLLVRAAYATRAHTYGGQIEGEFRGPLAPAILTIEVRASGLEIIRFYGFGNESDASQPDSVYQVRQKQFVLAPTVSVTLAPRVRFAVGPLVKYAHTQPDSGTLLTRTGPYYGAGDFGQVGARAVLELDTRDSREAAAQGVYLRLAAQGYPTAWDAAAGFATLSAEASTYLSAGDPPTATIALRLAGAGVTGRVPFHEVVFVGGETTVRGYAEQRFAGRRGAYANAELRLPVARPSVGDIGLFGLADVGRVWVPGGGASSDRWHGAAGGGLWFAWRHRRANTVSIAAAKSPERTAIYVRAGFLF